MLRLMMRRGPTPGAIYELEDAEITIGRGSKNQIIIRDNEVSREHCRLVRLIDQYEVVDLNSSTGTFVNGQRVVGSWLLQPGSIIELGDSITLEYERLNISFLQKPPVQRTPAPSPDAEPANVRLKHSLLMTIGPSVGRSYPLTDVIVTIGRDLSNDIVIQDPEISRYHLRLRRHKQTYVVEDMGSTNGTFLNNLPLDEPQTLESDDVLKLGTMVQLQYVCQPYEASENEEEEETSAAAAPPKPTDAQLARDETIRLTFVNGNLLRISRLGTGLTPGALRDHIFIAYARDDWQTVASLILSMQDAGLKAWVDQYLIQNSDDWRAALEQALLECRLMVLVVSDHSLENPVVQASYQHFLEQQKPIIPLLFQQGQTLPPELMLLRSIVFDTDNPRKSFHKLIFEIMQHRR
jgi:pSer/pThr/pTyr-binding forkhead associated (FHA) protein